MAESPRLSIGMPVFNGERYLSEAIEALLRQSFGDFELLISDNASTDGTEAICRRFASSDSRVQYHRLDENIGAIGNFNHVCRLASGEYFKWAAADDRCMPTLLERLVEILDSEPDVVWCHCQSGKIDADGSILTAGDPAAEGLHHTTAAGLPRAGHDSPNRVERFRGVLCGTTWCADIFGLIRRNVFDVTELLEPCYGSEKVLIGGFALVGKYREVPETLFFQRVHALASGNLKSANEQAQFAGPKGARTPLTPRLRLLAAHWRMVHRVPMSRRDRLQCIAALGNYLLQIRKWKRVAKSVFTGAGVGH